MFMKGGFGEVSKFIDETLPAAERENLAPAYLAMLREMLGRIYFADFADQQQVTETEFLFLQDAVEAIGSLRNYGSPVFLDLVDYNHIESTGLQIAQAPGKNIVYLGCALLIAGIFLLFYLPQRRIWLWLSQDKLGTHILMAGMSNRNPRDFNAYFEQISEDFKRE
jgi:cytochrome c biogenesis protein